MAQGTNPMNRFFLAQIFLETRQSSASIEPFIDLLACLEQTLWPKNPAVVKV